MSGRVLSKISFRESEFLENFKITTLEKGTPNEYKKVKLYNTKARILLTIPTNTSSFIQLFGYYKADGAPRGSARCALFALLNKLLKLGEIKMERNVHVEHPTPSDQNLPRLIKLYKEIGFAENKPTPGNPTNLDATVGQLLEALGRQCKMIVNDKEAASKQEQMSKVPKKMKKKRMYRPKLRL